jgi:hypothetical protein
MLLLEARATSSTWTVGNSEEVHKAMTRALEIAQDRGDTASRMRLLVGLHVLAVRVADARGSFAIAEELQSAARTAMDTSYMVLADFLLCTSHHFMGNQVAARQHYERGCEHVSAVTTQFLGLDYRLRASVTFDRVLWLSGFPDRAMKVARDTIVEAERVSKPVNVCFTWLYVAPLFLWCGDTATAREALEKLMAHPNWHALPSLHATAFAVQGELLIREGHAERGTTSLRSAIAMMRADRQIVLLARAGSVLAESLAACGRLDEALIVIDGAIADAESSTEMSQFPELLRVKADILASMPQSDESQAEELLARALEEARRQGALAWELRAAMTLAQIRLRQGRAREGGQLLSAAYARFSEGFETADLKAARELLARL